MTQLMDTHYLARSGRYTSALNANDRLPIVYGDLTDGSGGIWTLPCIDTANYVYAFAGHEVISVANGNSVSIYADGVLVNPANYTFDELNDYESEGNIAIVTFDSDQANTIITARGKGKPTATGGATLMENIIDIVYDFLTVESDFTSALFESTAKARASQIFTSQSYAAAGVIDQDAVIWETLASMMGSFLGSVFVNGNGDLVLDIDINTIPYDQPPIIGRGDGVLIDAKIRKQNIINRCPANYCYNYSVLEFKEHTDSDAHADAASQTIFGTRTPTTPYQFYWCRDLTSIQIIQDLIVAKLKGQLYEIEIDDITLKRLQCDIGDFLVYSAERLYGSDGQPLLNNYWKVMAVKPDIAKNKMTFRALQAAYFMTVAYLADGSYEADGSIKAGGNRDTTVY